MTIAYGCIVLAMFIPILCAAYSKYVGTGYDNHTPREFYDRLQGKGKRAYYAQLNSYEGFAPYAAGVIVAHQLHAPQNLLNILALGYVVVRVFYVIFYVNNQHIARSCAWFSGLFITVALFFIGK